MCSRNQKELRSDAVEVLLSLMDALEISAISEQILAHFRVPNTFVSILAILSLKSSRISTEFQRNPREIRELEFGETLGCLKESSI